MHIDNRRTHLILLQNDLMLAKLRAEQLELKQIVTALGAALIDLQSHLDNIPPLAPLE